MLPVADGPTCSWFTPSPVTESTRWIESLKSPGYGIGLGVTKQLLEQNGGKISLLSEPGRGLEVTIMLPVFRETGA